VGDQADRHHGRQAEKFLFHCAILVYFSSERQVRTRRRISDLLMFIWSLYLDKGYAMNARDLCGSGMQ
jgi:hypothetical protein